MRRIGHKGADAVVAGNTLESFDAAVELGVDAIEADVLRVREGRLVVAHDPEDAMRRRPLELVELLDAVCAPPLDQVDIHLDLKLPGREAELAGLIAGHGLIERTSVSTMEMDSIVKLRRLEPDLHVGWTFPKTRLDWTRYPWAAPGVAVGLAAMRRFFPKALVERAPELDVQSTWVYDPIVTPRLVEAADEAGVELVAWTVDDPSRIEELSAMGVAGICTNDPRLFDGPPDADDAAGEVAPED